MLDFINWNLTGHDAGRIEDPVYKNIFENSGRKNDFEVEKVGHKNYVIWNCKDSDSIPVDPNHSDSN